MTRWPEPTNVLIPEGHYTFRLSEEPELEEFPYTVKRTGEERTGTKIKIFVIGTNESGEEFNAQESLFAWDPRYTNLCAALNVDHGRDIRSKGSTFEADVKYEPDRKNPTKSWPRIINIAAVLDFPADKQANADDDVPF
jgi:hypothetical protein